MLSHEHLLKASIIGGNFLNQTDRDTILQFALPMHHIMGLGALLLTAISRGSTLVMLPGLSIDALLDTVEKDKVTIFMGVPFVYRLMLRHATEKRIRRDTSSVRLCVVGGAPTSAALIKEFRKLYRLNIVQFYGLTEAATLVSCQSPDGNDKPGSAGRALPGWSLKILTADGKVAQLNEPGEILVSGLITKGYYNNPAATAIAIDDGWFRTGDIGLFDSDRELYICGRKKEMIIAKGQNIYPSDIEAILRQHPKIASAKVHGEPDELRGEIITASVRLKNGTVVSEEEIRHFCRHHLANYKIPRRISLT
jgi:long-chain acyl-CoA synthetase